MRNRLTVLTALAVAVGLGTSATAAPKACDMIKDSDKDGNFVALRPVLGAAGYSSPTLEILGGDVASGKSTVIAQLRVKSTKMDPSDFQTLNGVRWGLNFKVGGTSYGASLEKSSDSDAGNATLLVDGMPVSGGIKSVKVEAQAITWTIERKKIAILMKKANQKFSGISASSSGRMGTWYGADDGSSQVVYTDKGAHCRLRPA